MKYAPADIKDILMGQYFLYLVNRFQRQVYRKFCKKGTYRRNPAVAYGRLILRETYWIMFKFAVQRARSVLNKCALVREPFLVVPRQLVTTTTLCMTIQTYAGVILPYSNKLHDLLWKASPSKRYWREKLPGRDIRCTNKWKIDESLGAFWKNYELVDQN